MMIYVLLCYIMVRPPTKCLQKLSHPSFCVGAISLCHTLKLPVPSLLIHLPPCSGPAQKLLTARNKGKFKWDFLNL